MTGGMPIGDDDLHGYVDKRLEPERMAAVETYIATHPDAAAQVLQYQEQRQALRSALQHKYDEPVPVRLRIAGIQAERQRRWRRSLGRIAASGLWLLIGAAGGWIANEELAAGRTAQVTAAAPSLVNEIAQEALAAHRIYTAEVRHPVEVDVTQEKHLVEWLSKRLARPLRVPDLSAQGYQLMGGRLLPASAGPAAQLMYEDGTGRRLTVYLTAEGGGETSFLYVHDKDLGGFYWRDAGFGYAVLGQADRRDLLATAEAIYRQTGNAVPVSGR
jgi:anti-sigma factor RsiW